MNIQQFQLNARVELTHWWFTARRAILRTLIEELVPPSRAMTIVDVGCGTGGNIASLADRYRCIGIDPSPTAIAFATQRFPTVHELSRRGAEPFLAVNCAALPESLIESELLEAREQSRA